MAIKVSVIIPAFNVEKYVSNCFESLISQTMQDFEIICVDDASKDKTYEILCEYSNKYSNITCMRNTINKGAAFSRNRGVELAKGKYVIFLDSDDTYHPQLLEKLYLAAESEEADVAICNVNYYDKNGMVLCQSGWNQKLIESNILTIHDNREHIFSGILTAPWNKLVKKDFLEKNSIFFQDLKTSNDVFYSMLVVACAEKMILIQDVLVYYFHERPGNITQYKNQKKDYLICAYEEVIKGLKERELWKGDIQKSGITSMVNRCYSIATASKQEVMGFYIDEWKSRIVPFITVDDVRQIGDSWLYYQYLFLIEKISLYENKYQLFSKELQTFIEKLAPDKIVLWGAGRLTQQLFDAVPDVKQHISYIVDNDVTKQGNYLFGIKICAFENVKDEVDKYIVLNENFIEEIKQQVGDEGKLVNMKQVMDSFPFGIGD